MALVLYTIKDFKGSCEVGHQVYWPFIDNEAYLARESSPMAYRIHRPNSPGMFYNFFSFLLLNPIWGLTHYRALKFLVTHTFDYAEPVPLEIVPSNSPVPLEVVLPSPRGHHDPFFASSSKVAGDLLSLIPASYDLLLILFVMLLNSKIQTLT